MRTTNEKRTPIALVALLSFALPINYVDRGSIGIVAPLIQKEFELSASQMGWVLAAFFWAYAPLQPLMGWLAVLPAVRPIDWSADSALRAPAASAVV